VVEKSRGPGGRCSSRRIAKDYKIDLGAPGFLSSDGQNPELQKKIIQWQQCGHLINWTFKSSSFNQQSISTTRHAFNASPSLNAWHRHLIADTACLTQSRVHHLERKKDYWQLRGESGQLILTAATVIVSAPVEQALTLLKKHPLVSPVIDIPSQLSLPQYTCVIAVAEPLQALADVYQGEHPVLTKAIRENSKPGRQRPFEDNWPEIWTLHSSHSWALQQDHKAAVECAPEMQRAFCKLFNVTPANKILTTHYWRLAGHQNLNHSIPSATPYLWDDTLQLGCCGDWLAGGGIYGALISSQSLCKQLTRSQKH
jgi:hypothetical protein